MIALSFRALRRSHNERKNEIADASVFFFLLRAERLDVLVWETVVFDRVPDEALLLAARAPGVEAGLAVSNPCAAANSLERAPSSVNVDSDSFGARGMENIGNMRGGSGSEGTQVASRKSCAMPGASVSEVRVLPVGSTLECLVDGTSWRGGVGWLSETRT